MTGGTVLVLGPTGRNFAAGMSGGVAFVHDPRSLLPRRLNFDMVELERLEDADREQARGAVPCPFEKNRLEARRRTVGPMGRDAWRDRQSHAPRLPPGAGGDPARVKDKAARSTRRSWRLLMADPEGFFALRAQRTAAPARPRAPMGLAGGLSPLPARGAQRAGCPLHELRHRLLPRGLPARQLDPGVERPGPLRAALPRRATASGRRTTSPSSPAASVQRRVRAPACWAWSLSRC